MIHTREGFRFESEYVERIKLRYLRKCLRIMDGLLNRKLAN